MKKLKIKLPILMLIVLVFLSYINANAQVSVAGVPSVSMQYPSRINEYKYETLTLDVKNTGGTDVFNVVPTSKSGIIIFSPASYEGYLIAAGEEKKFEFRISIVPKGVAGEDPSGKTYIRPTKSDTMDIDNNYSSSRDKVDVIIQAQLNPEKVTKTFDVDIILDESTPSITPKASGFQVIYVILGITFVMFLLKRVR